MYNGIGLATVRGSGTNGYVQKNAAHVSRQRTAQQKRQDLGPDPFASKMKDPRKANTEIVDHNRKREVELKVLTLRDELEGRGVPEDKIDAQAEALRSRLMARLPPPGAASASAGGRAGETHSDAAMKERENAALKQALGIKGDYVGGSAFDRELQEREKEERMAKRQAEVEAREAAEAELEREREREERKKRKEERRAEKAERKEERKRQKRADKSD